MKLPPISLPIPQFLKKLGIKPPYDPAIPLLGTNPEEIKIEKYTCIPLFAALFTIARTWKHSELHTIETSSYKYDQLFTSFLAPLPSLKNVEVELKIPSFYIQMANKHIKTS